MNCNGKFKFFELLNCELGRVIPDIWKRRFLFMIQRQAAVIGLTLDIMIV